MNLTVLPPRLQPVTSRKPPTATLTKQASLFLRPDSVRFRGRNALHVSAEADNSNELQELLKDGDVTSDELNEADENGNTPLHLACLAGALNAARKLLGRRGIQWNLTNKQHKTPKDLATNPAIIKLLEKKEGKIWSA